MKKLWEEGFAKIVLNEEETVDFSDLILTFSLHWVEHKKKPPVLPAESKAARVTSLSLTFFQWSYRSWRGNFSR